MTYSGTSTIYTEEDEVKLELIFEGRIIDELKKKVSGVEEREIKLKERIRKIEASQVIKNKSTELKRDVDDLKSRLKFTEESGKNEIEMLNKNLKGEENVKPLSDWLFDNFKRIAEAEKWFNKAGDESDKEKAIEYYRKAIELNPGYAEAHYKLGRLFECLKRYRGAEKEYKEAIRLNPNDADMHYNFGVLLKQSLGKYGGAAKEFMEVIRLNPNDAEAHFNLGILLYILERYDEAVEEYKGAIRLNPGDAKLHFHLGNLLKKLNRFEEAEKEYEVAISICPNHSEAIYNLKELRYYQKVLKTRIDDTK